MLVNKSALCTIWFTLSLLPLSSIKVQWVFELKSALQLNPSIPSCHQTFLNDTDMVQACYPVDGRNHHDDFIDAILSCTLTPASGNFHVAHWYKASHISLHNQSTMNFCEFEKWFSFLIGPLVGMTGLLLKAQLSHRQVGQLFTHQRGIYTQHRLLSLAMLLLDMIFTF